MSPKNRRRTTSILSIAAMCALAVGLWVRTEATTPPSRPEAPQPALADSPAFALAHVALPLPPAPEPPAPAETPRAAAVETPKTATLPPEAPKQEMPKPEAKKLEPPKPEAPKPEPPKPKPPAPKVEAISPPPTERTVVATPKDVRQGRVLLRQLEAGEGPTIEIAWPETAGDRDILYRTFVRCYGMVTAVLSDAGHLYRESGAPGENWRPDTDTFSQYARLAEGQMPPQEDRLVDRIRSRHRLSGGMPVRLFPRKVDAVLLSGLNRLAGNAYRNGQDIHARYQVSGDSVDVRKITVGAKPVPGLVNIGSGCR